MIEWTRILCEAVRAWILGILLYLLLFPVVLLFKIKIHWRKTPPKLLILGGVICYGLVSSVALAGTTACRDTGTEIQCVGDYTTEELQHDTERYQARRAEDRQQSYGEIRRAHEQRMEAQKIEVLGRLEQLGAGITIVSAATRVTTTTRKDV